MATEGEVDNMGTCPHGYDATYEGCTECNNPLELAAYDCGSGGCLRCLQCRFNHEQETRYAVGRKLGRAYEELNDERAENERLREAAKLLLESLEEYVRQSMHFNPEWRAGIKAIEAALAVKEPTP